MKTRLRRFGIVILSILTWAGNANLFIESGLARSTHFNAFLLGSSLACLVALIISEIAEWGRRLLESTRQEILLAELLTVDPGYVLHTQDEHRFDEAIAWRGARLEREAVGADRAWIDVRPPVEVEGLG